MRGSQYLIAALAMLSLSACESAEDKYIRLNSELLRAQLSLRIAEEHLDSLSRFEKGLVNDPTPGPKTTAYYDTVQTARAKVAVLQRDMSKFMGK